VKAKGPRPVNPGCSHCNRDRVRTRLFPVLDGHIQVPVCGPCSRFLKETVGSVREHFEPIILEYMADNPAFWHPDNNKEAK
jgi:hypothetical protein